MVDFFNNFKEHPESKKTFLNQIRTQKFEM
ncbi:MAG: hypothetical protein K0R65_2020 [Crocinitomicaceae bacterium]|jgi:hypothetical protein|nr:hypothetical protein [Crocinitomicaceae bacterium]